LPNSKPITIKLMNLIMCLWGRIIKCHDMDQLGDYRPEEQMDYLSFPEESKHEVWAKNFMSAISAYLTSNLHVGQEKQRVP
jgi:hypothetical protein